MRKKIISLLTFIGVFVFTGTLFAITYVFVPQGGTGVGTVASGTIMIGRDRNAIATTTWTLQQAAGTNGQILKIDGSGAVTWQADNTGGTGSSVWSTSTDNLVAYWTDSVVVGHTATSADVQFEVVGDTLLDDVTFANASSTNGTYSGYLTVAGLTTLTTLTVTNASSTNGTYSGYLTVAGQTTLGDLTVTNASSTNGSYSGYLNITGTTTMNQMTYPNYAGPLNNILYLKSTGEVGYTATSSWDTNTQADEVCSGTTTYLDGEGNCDDISSVYVNDGCTDCLNATEIDDIYLLTAGDTGGDYTFDEATSSLMTITDGTNGLRITPGATTTLDFF